MAEDFATVEWIATSNIYEVNLRQYSADGTFNSFKTHLPRLKDMGVDILWFMPVTPISFEKRQGKLGSYYACSSYTSINPEFGTEEDFISLVNEAHELGFKVMIDWVANHTGYDHHWTKEHPQYYKKNIEGAFYDANGWIDVIDLDYSNKELQKAMIDAMLFWVDEYDIDAIRCDMAHLVPLEFWRKARKTIDAVKPLFWLAETEEPSYHAVFDATYSWELLHKMEAVYRNEVPLHQLETVLQNYEKNFPANAIRLFFTSNHDENSHSGSEYERMGKAAKAFAVLCATWKDSLPLIYSGQEMPNKKKLQFFEKDPIDWTGQYLLHDFYATLLNMRKEHPALRAGDPKAKCHFVKTSEDENVLAFIREYGNDQVLVLLNLSPKARLMVEIKDPSIKGTFVSCLSGCEVNLSNDRTFEMQPWEYIIYASKQEAELERVPTRTTIAIA